MVHRLGAVGGRQNDRLALDRGWLIFEWGIAQVKTGNFGSVSLAPQQAIGQLCAAGKTGFNRRLRNDALSTVDDGLNDRRGGP